MKGKMLIKFLLFISLNVCIASPCMGRCNLMEILTGKCTSNAHVETGHATDGDQPASNGTASPPASSAKSPCLKLIGDWHGVVDGSLICADITPDCNMTVYDCNGSLLLWLPVSVEGGVVTAGKLYGWAGDGVMVISDGHRNYLLIRPQ